MNQFDVNTTTSSKYGIFKMPSSPEQAQIHITPVPWEVTTSYGAGTAQGPQLIRTASEQVDFLILEFWENLRSWYFYEGGALAHFGIEQLT